MRLYVTFNYQGTANRAEIERLCALVAESGWDDFCFIRDVEHWEHVFDDPRDLMARSRDEIAASDALLLDLTRKPTGRAIEAGIAYTLGKRVIVIARTGTPVKATSRGIAAAVIEYEALADIVPPLRALHAQWTPDA